MMLISSLGKNEKGSATLDALISVILISISLIGISQWYFDMRHSFLRRGEVLENVLLMSSSNHLDNWYFTVEDDDN